MPLLVRIPYELNFHLIRGQLSWRGWDWLGNTGVFHLHPEHPLHGSGLHTARPMPNVQGCRPVRAMQKETGGKERAGFGAATLSTGHPGS